MNKVLRGITSALLSLALAGCGFHPRGGIPDNSLARSVFVEGYQSPDGFASEFNRLMVSSGATLAPTANDAGAVIHITKVRSERRPVSLSKQGRANTYDLIFRLEYNVTTPKGEMLLTQQEVEVKRDYYNDQTSPLGQASEESLIRQEMQREAAQLLLRRIVYGLRHAAS